MPQVTVYVREDDLDQWKAIEKKSEFIHDALIMAKLPPEVLKRHTIKEAVKQPQAPIVNAPTPPTPEGQTITIPNVAKKPFTFPPSAASNLDVIKTPEQAKKIVENPQFIDKKYSARKPGSKERHVEL